MHQSIVTQSNPPAYRQSLATIVGIAFYGATLGVGVLLFGGPSHNLWSLQYLWDQTHHPLVVLLPASATVPATHLSGHLWQARALLTAGQVDQAESLLQPALDQGNYDAQRLYAEILVARGDIPGAVQVWSQLGAVDDILAMAQQATQRNQLDDAAVAYRAAYELAPERTVLPFAYFLRRHTGDAAGAETLLRQFITAMPTSRYFLNWLQELGALYREQKAWEPAIALYSQLVVAAPDNVNHWVQLGWLYYERGDGAEKAMAEFQQAVAITPQEGDGYYAIASLFSREKQFQTAESWYVQALEREPEQQWWWLSRAAAAEQAGNLTLALHLHATIAERFPTFAPGYYQAAWAYRKAEQREQAVTAIEQAIQLMASNNINQPQSQASYYARAGQIYEWSGQLQQAVAAYERAEQLDPLRQDVQSGLLRLQ